MARALWLVFTTLAWCGATAGCSALRLRPANQNHADHVLKVTGRLGIAPESLQQLTLDPPEVCDKLDRRATGWTATSIVAGVLGGGAGISTTVLDEHTPRWATGSVTVALSALSALSGFMSTHSAQRYATRCTVNTGGR